jgi:hypothetical protein
MHTHTHTHTHTQTHRHVPVMAGENPGRGTVGRESREIGVYIWRKNIEKTREKNYSSKSDRRAPKNQMKNTAGKNRFI